MKAVTIHVDESVYQDFQELARQAGHSTSHLIREAMADYRRQRMNVGRRSLADALPAASVGGILEMWAGREDLLRECFDRS